METERQWTASKGKVKRHWGTTLVPWITWSGGEAATAYGHSTLWRDSQGKLRSPGATSTRKCTTTEEDWNLIFQLQYKKRPWSWTPTPVHNSRKPAFAVDSSLWIWGWFVTLPGDQTSSVSSGLSSKPSITCCPFLSFAYRYHFSLGHHCHWQSKVNVTYAISTPNHFQHFLLGGGG